MYSLLFIHTQSITKRDLKYQKLSGEFMNKIISCEFLAVKKPVGNFYWRLLENHYSSIL